MRLLEWVFAIPQHHRLGESAHREGGAGRSLRRLFPYEVRYGSGGVPGGHPGRETDCDHPETHKFLLVIFSRDIEAWLTWSVKAASSILQMLFDKLCIKSCQLRHQAKKKQNYKVKILNNEDPCIF